MFWRSFIFCQFLKIYIFAIDFVGAAPAKFEINIRDKDEYTTVVVKKAENPYLISRNVPIWKISNNGNLPYEEIKNVMKELGDLSLYYNVEKEAAFVHSSSCNCVSGVIDFRYYMNNVPMDEVNKIQDITTSQYVHFRSLMPHVRSNSTSSDLNDGKKIKQPEINRRAMNKTLYPEILIVLNDDFFRYWPRINAKMSNKILYTISLINAANMFYSESYNPVVKINIAGIIIETQENKLFSGLSVDFGTHLQTNVFIKNLITSNFSLFDKYKLNSKISFDAIFFLSSKRLNYDKNEVERIAAYPKKGVVAVKSNSEKCNFTTPISIISDDYIYKSYPTIAHEVYHLINQGSNSYEETDPCLYKYLDKYDNPSLESFEWSDDCCLLTNKPQSFDSSRMTTEEQCQCFGYNSANDIIDDKCTSILKCENQEGQVRNFAKIIDDLACQKHWERKRQELSTKFTSVKPTTSSTTTVTPIPPLNIIDNWSAIDSNVIDKTMFIYPLNHSTLNDDGLLCLGILMIAGEKRIVVTPKSCDNGPTVARIYAITRYREKFTVVPRDGEDLVLEKYFGITDTEVKISNVIKEVYISNIPQLLNLNDLTSSNSISDCHLIKFNRDRNGPHPYKLQFIQMDIVVRKNSKNRYIVESKNSINALDRTDLKGNSLYCKINNQSPSLVGMVIKNDAEKLQFYNLADLKNVISS